MLSIARMPVPIVLYQHVVESASLRRMRTSVVRGPHVRLLQLGRLDERIAANLDGLTVAAGHAWPLCEAALEKPSAGPVFAATIQAIEMAGTGRGGLVKLERLLSLCEAVPESCSGLLSAFGWLEAPDLRGIVAELLGSQNGFRRFVGIAACSLHRVDPGITTAGGFEDEIPLARARAWRTAGEIGRRELVSTAAAAIVDEDPACQFWAAWSAVLLGDKHAALDVVASVAAVPVRSGPARSNSYCRRRVPKARMAGWRASQRTPSTCGC
jgi:uncharacterized protein (TIGR02270 family)